VTTDLGTNVDTAYAMAAQATNKIVLAGEASGDYALARYDGSTTAWASTASTPSQAIRTDAYFADLRAVSLLLGHEDNKKH
jgi:hypothetical protein